MPISSINVHFSNLRILYGTYFLAIRLLFPIVLYDDVRVSILMAIVQLDWSFSEIRAIFHSVVTTFAVDVPILFLRETFLIYQCPRITSSRLKS